MKLAREVGLAGATFPAVYNAANEVAVDAFHSGVVRFTGIESTIRRVVHAHTAPSAVDLYSILAADAWARTEALNILVKH